MAEFREIARQYNRMCESYKNTGCVNCPMRSLGSLGLRKLCKDAAFFTPDTFVRVVERWAAAHPEPVYPTWAEWLMEHGLLYASNSAYMKRWFVINQSGIEKPIPADIAEKLGIEPKEG